MNVRIPQTSAFLAQLTARALSFPAPRPTLPRLATDQILDYYNSPDAGTGRFATTNSPGLSSASTVNAATRATDQQQQQLHRPSPGPSPSPSSPTQRSPQPPQRTRLPSAGGADNRRLHIVELDASQPTDHRRRSPSSESPRRNKLPTAAAQSNLLARRGVVDHSRLALVAPPDASPSAYTNLSPPDVSAPRSAPVRRLRHVLPFNNQSDNDGDESELATRDHRRTRSVIAHSVLSATAGDQGPTASRTGRRISGAGSTSPGGRRGSEREPADPTTWKRSSASVPTSSASERFAVPGGTVINTMASKPTRSNTTDDLVSPPRPQITASSSWRAQPIGGGASPKSRPAFLPHPTNSSTSSSQIVTPAIGEEKDPMARVAGPVIVGFPDLSNGLGYTLPPSQPSLPSLNTTSTNVFEQNSASGSRPPSGGIGPPPPRPPRATVARRVGTMPSPSETAPSTTLTKPKLTTMDSDYSLMAVTASSSGGSPSVRLSASSPTKTQIESEHVPEARHRREGAAGLQSEDVTLQRTSSASVDTFGPTTSDPHPSDPTRQPMNRGYSSPTATSRPSSSGSPEGNPPRPELVSRWSSNSSFPSTASPVTKRFTGGRNYTPLTVGEELEDLSLVVDRQLASMGLMGDASATLAAPMEARSGSRSPLDTVDEDDPFPKREPIASSPLPSPSLHQRAPSSRGASRSPPMPSPIIDISPTNAWTAHLKPGLGPVSPAILRPPTPLTDDPKPKSSPAVKSLKLQSTTPETVSDRPTVTRTGSSNSSRDLGVVSYSRDSPVSALPSRRSPSPAYSALKQYMSPSQTKLENANPRAKKQRNPRKLPPSMDCRDIMAKRNPLERLLGYARKMNELNEEEDSGLVDWIDWVRTGKRSGPVGKSEKELVLVRGPSTSSSSISSGSKALPQRPPGGKKIRGFDHPPLHRLPRMREVSHGSIASEVTFPVRPDAYVATNLSSPMDGDPIRGPPPNIPYPGLAQNAGVRNTIKRPQRSNTQPELKSNGTLRTPATPKTNGGFFSSLGRKASLRKQQPGPSAIGSPSGSMGISSIVSRPSHVSLGNDLPPPVPIKMNPPTLVGGPRPAPTKRANNLAEKGPPPPPPIEEPASETIPEEDALGEMESFGSHTNDDDASSMHSASVAHSFYGDGSPVHPPGLVPRSSLSYRAHGHGRAATQDENPDAIFAANLEKVTDVLPHVDRETLALYLRKAGGEDMRAIGSYLEDKRKGAVMSA